MTTAPPNALISPYFYHIEDMKRRVVDTCKDCDGFGWLKPGSMCECLKSVTAEYRFLCSNIPATYKDVRFDQFVKQEDTGFKNVVLYTQKLEKCREKGLGLHIWSAASAAGKTMLATCVLLEAIQKGYWVWFTSMTQLLEDIRRGFDDANKRTIIEWAMFKTDFLMLDELTKFHNPDSGWVTDRLNDLIQRRVNEKLPIITTDNVSLENLTNKYQNHLISRFEGRQIEVAVNPKVEYRKDVQKKENLKFFKEL